MKKLLMLFFLFNCSLFSQTNDEQFNTFFQSFKIAVNDQNMDEIIKLTNFPFLNAWLNLESPISMDSFKTQPILPDVKILSNAKFNKTVKIKENGDDMDIDFQFSDGNFIISYTMGNAEDGMFYTDYYFNKINDEYKYIKASSGD